MQVRWAPAHYIFHIKATTFDDRSSDVSTANLTSRYYATTRDAEVIDTDPTQVGAIEATFANDWRAAPNGTPRSQTVQAPGLLWSPNTPAGSAETAMVAEIDAARHSVGFESEELSDVPVYQALAADARRGVLKLPRRDDGLERVGPGLRHSHARGLQGARPARQLERAVHPREARTRAISGTPEKSMLGSGPRNASWESPHVNRELGLVIHTADGGAGVINAASARQLPCRTSTRRRQLGTSARLLRWISGRLAPLRTSGCGRFVSHGHSGS